jgi:hypothetical protein
MSSSTTSDRIQFDMSTYWGRLMHFTVTTDMRMLFTTRAQLDDAANVIRAYERVPPNQPHTADERAAYFHARNVRSACLHPETGQLIAWPLRFCSFVPVNVVLVAAMTLLPPTTPYLAFGQWLNQSLQRLSQLRQPQRLQRPLQCRHCQGLRCCRLCQLLCRSRSQSRRQARRFASSAHPRFCSARRSLCRRHCRRCCQCHSHALQRAH